MVTMQIVNNNYNLITNGALFQIMYCVLVTNYLFYQSQLPKQWSQMLFFPPPLHSTIPKCNRRIKSIIHNHHRLQCTTTISNEPTPYVAYTPPPYASTNTKYVITSTITTHTTTQLVMQCSHHHRLIKSTISLTSTTP